MLGDMNKYRPATFDEVVGQEKVVERLRNQSRTGVWFGSLILEGHWGSGKTTLARILMRAMNCEHPVDGNPCCTCASCRAILNGTSDCREIDAASNTGVDNVRSIIEWASYRPVALRYKVIVIDEAQQLSASAWNAMLKLIEEPPEYMKFIFCTTEVKKIPETIRSRSAHYQLGAIPESLIAAHIQKVATNEGLEITAGAAMLLAKQAHGAMRDGLRLLREMSAGERLIDEALVQALSPVGEDSATAGILGALLNASMPELLQALGEIEKSGRDFVSLCGSMVSLSADCLIRASGADVTGSDDYRKVVDELCRGRGMGTFLSLSDIVLKLRAAMYDDPHREHFLVTAASCFAAADSGLSLRVEALEKQIRAMQSGQFVQAVSAPEEKEPAVPEQQAVSAAVETDYPEYDERLYIPDDQLLAGYVPADEQGVPFDEDVPRAAEASDTRAVQSSDDDEEDDWGAFNDLDSLFGGGPSAAPVSAVKSVWKEPAPKQKEAVAAEVPKKAYVPAAAAEEEKRRPEPAVSPWGNVSPAGRREPAGQAVPQAVQTAEPYAIAKRAEQAFNEMMLSEPALKIHIQQRAIRTQYTEKGLMVFCRDISVMKLILAFAGKYQITGIEVMVG